MAKAKKIEDLLKEPAKARDYLAANGADAANVAAMSDDEAVAAALAHLASNPDTGNKPDAEVEPAPAHLVKVKRADATSFGFGAHSYEPDAKGVFTIPVEALDVALSHGFERA